MQTEKRNDVIWLAFPTKTGYNSDFEFENVYGYRSYPVCKPRIAYNLGKKCLFSETAFYEHLILLNNQNIHTVTFLSRILKAADYDL